ncbi:MAG TPA: hypothetical protein VHU81_17320 [Thermoanaerobaculia bacterium]|jgi:hypothetical protein|nr:hypothetical protein [Thermoanaerobaculia bacterium]
MNGRWILAAAALALAAPALASADETVRTLTQQLEAANLDELGLDFPVGELIVEAWDRPQVQIEVRLECGHRRDACREAAEAVKLAPSTRGRGLELELEGWPKHGAKGLEAHVQVYAPRQLVVDAELGVGDLRINGMEGHVRAELGVGDLSLDLPEAAVATVSLEAGVGDASLSTPQKRYKGSGFVGQELRWRKGAGRADVRAECGVGDVKVALR